MRGSCLGHALIRLLPSLASVFADADAAFIVEDGVTPPHLRAWKIVGAAVDAPHPTFHFWIKNNPVRRVQPALRNTRRGAHPRLAPVFTAEKADIGIGDEAALRIKRIEVDAVRGGDVESSRGPTGVVDFARVL